MGDERTDDTRGTADTSTEVADRAERGDDVIELPERTSSPDAPLFADDRSAAHRARWDEIQTRFVDDPRRAVQDADDLVSSVIGELQASFETRREALEASLQRGDDASTEELRVALQGYRSFFGRLLDA
jgi:hypothetical protein